MSLLSINNGPECTRCGLPGSDPIVLRDKDARGGVADRRIGRYTCSNCGAVWFDQPPWKDIGVTAPAGEGNDEPEAEPAIADGAGGVVYHPIRCLECNGATVHLPHCSKATRCPKCDGTNIKNASTRRMIRYHKCKDCKHTFKSHE